MDRQTLSLTLSEPTEDEYYVVYVDDAYSNAGMDHRHPHELFFDLWSMEENRLKDTQSISVFRRKDLSEDDYPGWIIPEDFMEGYTELGKMPTPYRVLTWVFERYYVRGPNKGVIDQFMPFFERDQNNHLIKRLSHLFQRSHDATLNYTRMMAKLMEDKE